MSGENSNRPAIANESSGVSAGGGSISADVSSTSREKREGENMGQASLHIADQHPSGADQRRPVRASDAQGMRERADAREV